MQVRLAILLLESIAYTKSKHDQIMALLQTVFGLLNDLVPSNKEVQFTTDQKNETYEWVGAQTIEQFTKIKSLNQKLFQFSIENRIQQFILYGMNKDKRKSQEKLLFFLMNYVLVAILAERVLTVLESQLQQLTLFDQQIQAVLAQQNFKMLKLKLSEQKQNSILEQVKIIFKKQVAQWSGIDEYNQ